MRELRRIDVLLNEETGERFDEGDIIKITTSGTYSKEYVGAIKYIETLKLTLDMSKEYNSNTTEIQYEDILRIDKIIEFAK